jgi:hypothetical protein
VGLLLLLMLLMPLLKVKERLLLVSILISQLLLLLQQVLHTRQLSTGCIPVCCHCLFVGEQLLQLRRLPPEVPPHAQLLLLQLLHLLQRG